MSALAIARPLRRAHAARATAARQTVAGLIMAAVAAAITIYATHHATLKGVAVVLVVLGSLWFASTRRTHLALALLMLYLGLLDGYLKLASGSNLVTFVRDAFLFALVVGLLVRATVQHRRLPLPPLSGWVICFAILVFVQLANPEAGTLVHSLAGVRQHLEFVPLFFLAYAFLRTVKALRMLVILLGVTAALNGIASLVQYSESPAQFAKWGPGYSQRVLGTGVFSAAGRTFVTGTSSGHTRPFGLGSDSGAGGLFGMFALCGVIALASFSTRRRDRLFAVVLGAGALLAIITSQDRAVIVSSVIVVLMFGILTATSRNRLTSLVGLALAGVVAFFVIQGIAGSSGSTPLRYKGLTPSSIVNTTTKARGRSIAKIPHNLFTYPFGAGLGTAGPASTAPGASQLTTDGNVDTETTLSFLIVETGIPGMLVLTGLTVTLLLLGLRRVRREPDREARVLLAVLIAPVGALLALFFIASVTPSVPAAPYLWTVGGIVSYWLIALPAARRRQASNTGQAADAITSAALVGDHEMALRARVP